MFFSALDPLARECERALSCASEGDLDAARSAVDKTRYLRSIVESQSNRRINTEWQVFGSEAEVDEVYGRYAEIARRANQQLELIYRWLTGSFEGFSLAELQSSEAGLNLWLDIKLPRIWDFKQDVVVLYGEEGQQLLPLLVLRGQRSIVWINDNVEPGLTVYRADDEHPQLDAVSLTEDLTILLINPGVDLDADDYAALVKSAPPRFCLLAYEACDDKVAEFHKVVRSIATKAISMNSVQGLARRITRQWLNNLPALFRFQSVLTLSELFNGSDVLIASPGPSLGDSLEHLRLNRNRFLVLAPLRSIPDLREAGIVADFAVWADPNGFTELLPTRDMVKGTALLISESAHPQMFSDVFDRIFTIPEPALGQNPLTEIAHGADIPIMPGGSVSVVASILAAQLQARSITLVGQDLSYSDVRYSKKSPQLIKRDSTKKRKRPKQGNTLSCRAIDGGTVKTQPDYLHFISEFESVARVFKTKCLLINSTQAGAFLEGWDHIPLDLNPVLAFESGNSYVDIQRVLKDTPVRHRLDDWNGAINSTLALFDTATKICEALVREILYLIEMKSNDVRGVENLEEKLEHLMGEECGILKFYTSSNSIIIRSVAFSVQSLEENLKLSCDYYRSILAAANYLSGTLRDTQTAFLENVE